MYKALNRGTVARLYREYGFLVEARCRRFFRDPHEVADVVQDIFVALLERAGAFRGEASWTTYLYRTSTNRCLNRLSTSKRRAELIEEHGDQLAPPSRREADALEARKLLRAILDVTDSKTREIVYYTYIDGLSQEQIGELMNMTGSAVGKRLRKFQKLAHKHRLEWQAA